jgi:hypothetical protein
MTPEHLGFALHPAPVIAGLDPAIQLPPPSPGTLDARRKPGHDRNSRGPALA